MSTPPESSEVQAVTVQDFEQFLAGLPQRDTTPPGVKAVGEYTFDELITHLHDYHGYGVEDQTRDEESNGILSETDLDRISKMTRDEAIARMPGHYFQEWDGPDSIEAARMHHNQDHADAFGGGGKVHFHPGAHNFMG